MTERELRWRLAYLEKRKMVIKMTQNIFREEEPKNLEK